MLPAKLLIFTAGSKMDQSQRAVVKVETGTDPKVTLMLDGKKYNTSISLIHCTTPQENEMQADLWHCNSALRHRCFDEKYNI